MPDSTDLLEVINPAQLSLLMDVGRTGLQHQGIAASGPMDPFAYRICNVLLCMTNATVIEVCGSGFALRILKSLSVCVTGGKGECQVNGVAAPMWRVLQLHAGDELSIQASSSGYRFYVGISAAINSQQAFGSSATVMREKLGGLNGQGSPLLMADKIQGIVSNAPLAPLHYEQNKNLTRLIHNVYSERRIRLIPGSQFKQFDTLAWMRLLSSTYTLDNNSNRMGIRLQGQCVSTQNDGMLSEGLTMGSVQVPPDGQPIILMADRQTLGGYPKIANVAILDLPYLAQRQPGSSISFTDIDLNAARNHWRLREKNIHHLRKIT